MLIFFILKYLILSKFYFFNTRAAYFLQNLKKSFFYFIKMKNLNKGFGRVKC
ncbi:hypothetical protein D3C71_32030 [compost metagenome]